MFEMQQIWDIRRMLRGCNVSRSCTCETVRFLHSPFCNTNNIITTQSQYPPQSSTSNPQYIGKTIVCNVWSSWQETKGNWTFVPQAILETLRCCDDSISRWRKNFQISDINPTATKWWSFQSSETSTYKEWTAIPIEWRRTIVVRTIYIEWKTLNFDYCLFCVFVKVSYYFLG